MNDDAAQPWLQLLVILVRDRRHVHYNPSMRSLVFSEHGIASCRMAQAATFVDWRSMPTMTPASLLPRTMKSSAHRPLLNVFQPEWFTRNQRLHDCIRVFHASSDGNCLFNTASIFVCGSEAMNALLRLHTLIELVLNWQYYMDFNVGCVGEFEALQSEDVEVILRNTVERCAQDML
jgi:hypothetical protein